MQQRGNDVGRRMAVAQSKCSQIAVESVVVTTALFEISEDLPKLGHVTPASPIRGRFMVPTQGGSVLCTKFEADSSFRSKVIRVPKFRNWVT